MSITVTASITSGRASASRAIGRAYKAVKNGTSSSLPYARIKKGR